MRLIVVVLLISRIGGEPFVSTRTLADLWTQRRQNTSHLFPMRTSPVYPEFAQVLAINDNKQAIVHQTKKDVVKLVEELNGNLNDARIVHSICSYRHLNSTFYVTNLIEEPGTIAEVLIDANMSTVENKMSEMTEKRIKINFICVGSKPDAYSAVWHISNKFVNHFIIESAGINEILAKDRLNTKYGYYADCFQVYQSDNTTKAIMIWRKGFGRRHRVQFGYEFDEMLADMSRTDVGLLPMTATSLSRSARHSSRHRLSRWIVWQARNEFDWRNELVVPRNVTAEYTSRLLNDIIEEWMRENNVPSVSISIRKDNKEEYTASYGYADLITKTPAKTFHRYRIVSISKLITSMAISELFSSGYAPIHLLTRPLFATNGLLSDYCPNGCPQHLDAVNIIQLLEHSTGLWPHTRKLEFDMLSGDKRELLSRIVSEQAPKMWIKPGTRMIYSNVGYMLLGRVIERLSNMTYADFVTKMVLKPIGIDDAAIGEHMDSEKEVTYYSHDNANAYTSWNPDRMDAAAGWSMSPRSIAILFNHLELNKGRKYRWIAQPSFVKQSYGKGLQLGNDGSLYHIGSLAGSEAIGYSRNNVQVAMAINLRGKEQNEKTDWMHKVCRWIAEGKLL